MILFRGFRYILTGIVLWTVGQTVVAQSWVPKNIHKSTIVIEEFKYQDPNNTLRSVDREFQTVKKQFIENTNQNVNAYNNKLTTLMADYKHNYVTSPIGKVDEDYADKKKYRYILRREVFLGNKKVFNLATQKLERESYVAYRYFFYDRITRKKYAPYYFSGDQWSQLKRLTFWLNVEKKA